MNLKKAKQLRKALRESGIDPNDGVLQKTRDSKPRITGDARTGFKTVTPAGTLAYPADSGRHIYQSFKFQ